MVPAATRSNLRLIPESHHGRKEPPLANCLLTSTSVLMACTHQLPTNALKFEMYFKKFSDRNLKLEKMERNNCHELFILA